ncbi:deoxyguanosinetriphosphate triphosphohydrolase [Yinghuangia seranimata]|uniref:deoxyguanosinetriphosphate triphosphohydrolase n=1 Tax=Yinghuangia seranimata TaxID=408067 RepID=UPI00248AE6D5|nr:deoxyguanosinetriphosphate triphosphohydrolase [Yinghuangia seranimata]MDI2129258.1 deoxyguanosinetriphosphate triphosphohydrolase [Yinghuangia seranimata]
MADRIRMPAHAQAAYDDADRERWVPETGKRVGRTAFERDRARVLHSAALRRLAGKTQVVEPGESPPDGRQVPRTRLTHSLECGQIGRELGQALGCDPDLVEAACLAHDLGHPPFGHNGELALDRAAQPCGGFEGNAQSLRLLSRLEPKTFAETGPLAGRSVGLNLTRAGLDAVLKYPWPRHEGVRTYGVYEEDLEVFAWVRRDAPEGRRSLEAQVMDWSDDVAYSVHDFEDAVYSGRIDLDRLGAPGERAAVLALAADRYALAPEGELGEALDRLLATEFWPKGFDASRRAQARLKNTTSGLIGRLCLAAERETAAFFGPTPGVRYAADLLVPRAARLECAVLKALTAHYVMGRADLEDLRTRQRAIVTDLVAMLAAGAPDALDPALRPDYLAADTDAARLRVVVDQVASLTDDAAVILHRALDR